MTAINSSVAELPILPTKNVPSSGDNQVGTSIFHSKVSSTIQLIQPVSKLVKVKLEDENFLIWKQQVLIAIRGYGLEDFITGHSVVPPQFIHDESGAQTLYPAFVAHQRQDQLLTSWLKF